MHRSRSRPRVSGLRVCSGRLTTDFLAPELIEVEAELPMGIEGEKDQPVAAVHIEQNVVVEDGFPRIIARLEAGAQPFQASLGLDGMGGMREKGAVGLRETADSGNDVVEQAIEEARKGEASLGAQEEPEGL